MRNTGFHWQMSNVSPQTVIDARTIFIVTWLVFGRTPNMACTDHFHNTPLCDVTIRWVALSTWQKKLEKSQL